MNWTATEALAAVELVNGKQITIFKWMNKNIRGNNPNERKEGQNNKKNQKQKYNVDCKIKIKNKTYELFSRLSHRTFFYY